MPAGGRVLVSSFQDTGPAAVWARPRIPLVAGEQPSGLQRTLIVADSANGLSAEFDLSDWVFVPRTLTLTLYREPSDDWLLMDAATRIGPRGMGMAHATLADRHDQFGVATQPLLVLQRSA